MDVMLARDYENQNPRGWWISEKLDGVRAVWDGRVLVSRTGKGFHAPDWFVKDLPAGVTLDGELWEGRGMFQTTVGTVRKHNGDWSNVKYMIFDVVSGGGYEIRRGALERLKLPGHCSILKQTRCEGAWHLEDFEAGILESGGEGVMLRKSNSLYEHERSENLLKKKIFKTDEAVIIGYKDGKGKHAGRMGALICEYMGKVFNIGTGLTDRLREIPPRLGEIVTFEYFGLTDGGKPRHPSFVEVRNYE